MDWKVIKTEKDYQKAMKRLNVIFDSKKDSKDGDELELLSNSFDFPRWILKRPQFLVQDSFRTARRALPF